MNNDHQLRQDVLDELDFEPRVDAANIGVGVHDGVVTLTGFVSRYADKMAAERAARRVKGVKAIAQDIAIWLPPDKKTTDNEIAKQSPSTSSNGAVFPRIVSASRSRKVSSR